MKQEAKALIESAYSTHHKQPGILDNDALKKSIATVIAGLESGILRVAEKNNNNWIVQEWIKKAILLYFKTSTNKIIPGEFTNFYDKVPLQFYNASEDKFKKTGARIVPPASIRSGAFVAPNTVIMPSYINIGAYVDTGSLIDTWATIGSGAQIGKNVHISGGVGIGGVLEPLQASPTIIEDNCFIGARSEIVEGVIVESGSVISMGVYIGQSTKIYHREKNKIYYGRVPSGSVVVPGTLPDPKSQCHLYCAVIVKTVDQKTRDKTSINDILREESILPVES